MKPLLVKYAEAAEFYGDKAANEYDFKHAAKTYKDAASYWEAASKKASAEQRTVYLDKAQQARLMSTAYAGLIKSGLKA